MDLLDILAEKESDLRAPLAERMKPVQLEELVGQEKVLGDQSMLKKLIEKDELTSLVIYGPPGCGKTSLAKVIAKRTHAEFQTINAVTAGIKEIREVIAFAKEMRSMYQKKTILFIDEIHRFNKAQQDALLPHVESGLLLMIGATTENPYYEVNSALISRVTVIRMNALGVSELVSILKKALLDNQKGLGMYEIEIANDVLKSIAQLANGDARRALNLLENAFHTAFELNQKTIIDEDVLKDCVQGKAFQYDKNGDFHYDVASALIKSIRGSDPDAALHYLAKMILSGEDIKFIARRIVISASEDIGNADPMAIVVANQAAQAAEFIGLPEARIPLAQAVTYLATAPKSNAAYLGINKAMQDLETKDIGPQPIYLKDGTALHMAQKKEKHLQESNGSYAYPHDFKNGYVQQQYLPDEIKDVVYYEPTNRGYEINIKKYLEKTKRKESL